MVYFIHQRDHETLIIGHGDTNGSLPKIQTYSSDQYLFDDVNILLGLKITKLRIKIRSVRPRPKIQNRPNFDKVRKRGFNSFLKLFIISFLRSLRGCHY